MDTSDLELFRREVIKSGAIEAKLIHPSSVATAPWVRYKCQFGCNGYGLSYSCPPDTPDHHRTRELLDSYQRAILIHFETVKREGQTRLKSWKEQSTRIVEIEGEMFKDGYYRAFVLLAGPCPLCKECAKLKDEPCHFGRKARPSMEACGIDVYRTARNNGCFIQPLKKKTETQNNYCLLLVD